jgi:hypothetical protein
MLAHFPMKKVFEEFAVASLPAVGARELRIDTQAIMSPVAAAGALTNTLATGIVSDGGGIGGPVENGTVIRSCQSAEGTRGPL